MGCDIHVHVEKLDRDGSWRYQEPPTVTLFTQADGSPYTGRYWYWGRNYDLFALLADVRNGYGFAGCDTGDRVEPLDEPRGLPDDVSPEVRAEAEDWGVDGHSHSWFTLRELVQALDAWKERKKVHRGWVDPKGFIEWRDSGAPTEWCGGVSGGGVRHVDAVGMQRLIDSGEVRVSEGPGRQLSAVYTQVEWQTSQADSAGSSWTEFLDRIRPLTMDDGSDVRAVFWFDN